MASSSAADWSMRTKRLAAELDPATFMATEIGGDMALRHRMMNVLLRRVWTGQFAPIPCSHLDMISEVEPSSQVCDQCVELGETWPELRMCLICGHVGCCDDAKYQHARRHFEATGHPLMKPYGVRGIDFIWCYEDRALLDPV